MVLKIPGEIIIDDVAVAENLRLNIPNNHQGRLKCTTRHGDDVKQVDIAITGIECEKSLPAMTWTATAVGVDLQSKLPVKSRFVYYKTKKVFELQLNIGAELHHYKFKSFDDSQKQLSEMLNKLSQ